MCCHADLMSTILTCRTHKLITLLQRLRERGSPEGCKLQGLVVYLCNTVEGQDDWDSVGSVLCGVCHNS